MLKMVLLTIEETHVISFKLLLCLFLICLFLSLFNGILLMLKNLKGKEWNEKKILFAFVYNFKLLFLIILIVTNFI
jgi:hypothetical protein